MSFFESIQWRFPGIVSILRNGTLLVGTQWAEAGLRGIYVLGIGRLLGPELYGMWSYTMASYTFAMAFTMYGFQTLVPVRLGRGSATASAFLGTTLVLQLVLLVVAASVYVAHALWIDDDFLAKTSLLLATPALIGRGLALWSRPVFLGLDKSEIAFRLTITLRLLEVMAGLVALWLGAGLFSLLAIHALSWMAEAILSLRAATRLVPVQFHINGAELRSILREGAVLGITSTTVAFLSTAPLILTRYLIDDLAIVGQIGLATQIATLAVIAVQGLLSAALPVLSRNSARGDPRIVNYAILTALVAIAVFSPVIALAAAYGPELVSTIFGVQFTPAGELLAAALLVGALAVLPTGFWQILVVQNHRWPGVIAGGAGALSLILTLPPFVHAHGAFGALAAAALAWTIRILILIAGLLRKPYGEKNLPEPS